MSKVTASQILVKNERLEVVKLKASFVNELIISTKKKQSDVRKLKEVDQEELKLVVQL